MKIKHTCQEQEGFLPNLVLSESFRLKRKANKDEEEVFKKKFVKALRNSRTGFIFKKAAV